MKLSGLYTALISPFKDGAVDLEGLKELVLRQINAKVDGLVVLGTTAETPTLSAEEKELITKTAIDLGKGKIPIIVGCGSNNTESSKAEALKMKALGADALMLVCPYYSRPSQEGIYQHFLQIANHVRCPIIVYNIPGRTGQVIESKTLMRLAEIEHIVAIKQATGALDQAMDLIQQKIPLSLLLGDDALALPFIASGGHGLISVTSNLMPEELKELVHSALNNDFINSRKIHNELFPLFRALFIESNPVPIKTAMQKASLPAGDPRLPLCKMTRENEKRLYDAIENCVVFQQRGLSFAQV